MDVHSQIWCFIFSFLDPSDLARVGMTSYAWWKVIFGKRASRSVSRRIKYCDSLDLSGTGALYTRIRLQVFGGVMHLDLENTAITSKHLYQIAKKSQVVQYLNVSRCPLLKEEILFRSKKYFGELCHLNISYNDNFSILGLACVCS